MHYFITEETDVGPAILFEVEQEREGEAGFLGVGPAGWVERDGLVKHITPNADYQVRTEAELIASAEGRRALAAWHLADDSAHHAKGVAEFEAHRQGTRPHLAP